jgi:hypothetical protein
MLQGGKKSRRVRVLIDSRAKANYLKRRLVVEMGIPALDRLTTSLASPNREPIYTYGNYEV